MRFLAGLNFCLVMLLFIVAVWLGASGDIIVNDITHFTLLTTLPILAIGMFLIATEN